MLDRDLRWPAIIAVAGVGYGVILGASAVQTLVDGGVGRDAAIWALAASALTIWMPVLWLLRLIRMRRTAGATPAAAMVRVMVASGYNVNTGTSQTFRCFVRIRTADGLVWSQRVIHAPLFLTLGGADHQAQVRPCPGLRPMFVIDIPGRGTLWPAAGAWRALEPPMTTLSDFRAQPERKLFSTGRVLAFVGVAAIGLSSLVFNQVGLLLVGYLVVWVAGVWIWGAAPPGAQWPSDQPEPKF
ncbi:hypothetical protein F4553_000291 [Allocatelliglobosispora scoriae]|uniref:Uncharacterized protein n=1 Tax=Allocatelliglobosispora scoriae TaxID=643052 RepID=A0A841BJF4_9ACTN|nr:hypothetical protein [Allocatelliglobosispora scoriae]MBB5866912.1 hypothetical protein [Allocatelliglobosispora scoriae]